MKKIFAIALALVMVLSMASAFASYCTGSFDWTCATDDTFCGQGAVEVVPYVKVNNGCGGYDWQVSECASAVSSEKVYYALKLTVDAYADAEWWAEAGITLTYKGLEATKAPKVSLDFAKLADDDDFEDDEVNVFYYNFSKRAWNIVNDDFEIADAENVHVKAEVVGDKAADAKVCATLTSKNDFTEGIVGDYYVVYASEKGAIAAEYATLTYEVANPNLSDYAVFVDNKKVSDWTIDYVDGEIVATAPEAKVMEKCSLAVLTTAGYKDLDEVEFFPGVDAADGAVATLKVLDEKGGKVLVTYTMKDGKIRTIKNTPVCGEASYATIKDFFGLEIGTCVDDDLIADNFGWDFEQESCFSWSDKAASIVDAECVVAIPKTGDASVLAWLF